jgi:hypothetical protein
MIWLLPTPSTFRKLSNRRNTGKKKKRDNWLAVIAEGEVKGGIGA